MSTQPQPRFTKPTDQQIMEIGILFNDGAISPEPLAYVLSVCTFIIDRLYENGDVTKPCASEDN